MDLHHHHDHPHHAASGYGRAFVLGIGLNIGFVIVEVTYGVIAHSLALVADAGHNFGDALGLGLSWGAIVLARAKPSKRRTFGFRRSTIVASTANALVLLFVTGGLAWEAIRRFFSPEQAEARTMIGVATVGVVINAVAALLFKKDGKKDLNVGSAFLHLASDALLALGVAVAGAIILWTGWLWVDPAVTIALAITILFGTWSLLSRSLNLILDAVPEGIDPEKVRAFLSSLPGVVEVHDLHIWAMSTTQTALTAHLVMPTESHGPSFLSNACKELHDTFHIEHATLQVDPHDAPTPCALAPDEIV